MTNDTQRMVNVYLPSGFVGRFTLEAARQLYGGPGSQALVEWEDQPRSQQAERVVEAQRKHEELSQRYETSSPPGVPWWLPTAFLLSCALLTAISIWSQLR